MLRGKINKSHLILVFFVFLSTFLHAQSGDLKLELIHGDSLEEKTKKQLVRLLETYDLSRLLYTKHIVIDSDFRTIPHSHPILTLNTRHLKDDELLLATFIHEQFHWFVDTHAKKSQALASVKLLYPDPVINFPEGSGGEIDTYYHIIICYLEYRTLKRILGELKAYQIISFWQRDHYKWIYQKVLEDERKLEELIRTVNLIP